ncbi:MAG: hypothetical protein H6825_13510 [Planctomycetes bacterium]|nr:hypothetical protein [Planctomycetota bacterium]
MARSSTSRPPNAWLAAAALALASVPAAAQGNGSNFFVLHNGVDAVYAGLGAGGTQTAADGIGTWVMGEDLKGATRTQLGDWGFKLQGLTENVCVLGSASGPFTFGQLAIVFPNIALVELDGRNGHVPDVFTVPQCAGAALPGITSAGFIPYGSPAVGSTTFLLSGYPSAAALPSSLSILLPNGGLVPSSLGGTATLVGSTGLAALGIGSTGFCWTIDFTWTPSALPLLDDVDGLWHYAHVSPDDNQYWAMSTNELNAWQSQSVVLDGGATLQAFFSSLDYGLLYRSVDPVTEDALQPSAPGGGVYYATTIDAAGGNPGAPGAGFDLGRHIAWSQSGSTAYLAKTPGLANQDPAGGPFPTAIPTLGFCTWNDEQYNGPGSPPPGGYRLTWLTLDWDATFGVDPALAGEATKFLGTVRVPSTIPVSIPTPWPQPITTVLFPLLVHDTVLHVGDPQWPDPNGNPAANVGGTSPHIPLLLGSVCIGAPVVLQFGSSGLAGPAGPLVWDPDVNAPSITQQIAYLD